MPTRWIVIVEGEGAEDFGSLEAAEACALEWADATPGLEVAIYELSSVACAKVAKAKVRPAQMRRHERSP